MPTWPAVAIIIITYAFALLFTPIQNSPFPGSVGYRYSESWGHPVCDYKLLNADPAPAADLVADLESTVSSY